MGNVSISHASEDKKDVAQPIADALIANGVRVWIDTRELRIGHSLRRKIDEGLAKSCYGVVILSKFFFAKRWPQKELDGLVARAEEDIILPVWHGVSEDDINKFSPTLADLVAARTSDGPEEVVRQILEVVRPSVGGGGTKPDVGGTPRGTARFAGEAEASGSVPAASSFGTLDDLGSVRRVRQSPVDEALHARQREATFEAWRLLQVALGRAADLASPLQYRPDFRSELRISPSQESISPMSGSEMSRPPACSRATSLKIARANSRASRIAGDMRRQTPITPPSTTSSLKTVSFFRPRSSTN